MPITRIAGLLDYSGSAPFILAFWRWANTTPLDYRKRTRAFMEATSRPSLDQAADDD
jgi:AraC-like DNA-binding protein